MASFPVTIASFSNPTSANFLNSPAHHTQHSNENDEIVAVETKIGTGASTPVASTVLTGTGIGTSAWQTLPSTSTKLGYASVTAGQAGITTATDLTGLAITITVPAGGRDVMLFAQLPLVYSTVVNDRVNLTIQEGAAILSGIFQVIGGTSGTGQHITILGYLSAPSAGGHTYKLTLVRDTGTGSVSFYADANTVAFIGATLI